jgi:hypothetical protein
MTGCGTQSPAPIEVVAVSGAVSYRGRPVGGAQLTFRDERAAEPGFAISDAQGRFSCMTNDTVGIPPGNYVVTVAHPRRSLPSKYTRPELSTVKVQIKPDGPNELVIALED